MIVAYEDDKVRVVLEEADSLGYIIHVKLYEWSKEVFWHCVEAMEYVKNHPKVKPLGKLYAGIGKENKKLQKFASMFGFYNLEINVLRGDGEVHDLWEYRWNHG